MAALFIAAGMFIAEKVADKKQARKDRKRAKDDVHYHESQAETEQKLARRYSDDLVPASANGMSTGVRDSSDEMPPPPYEEVVRARGHRRGQ